MEYIYLVDLDSVGDTLTCPLAYWLACYLSTQYLSGTTSVPTHPLGLCSVPIVILFSKIEK